MPSQRNKRPVPVLTSDLCSNRLPSDRIADYIRNHTAADARVFSPHSYQMTYATGRPNASGFDGLVHQLVDQRPGIPGRPRAIWSRRLVRRLGFEYVHAPDAWVEYIHAPDSWVESLARGGGPAAQRSPPVRAPRPRRLREPLPRSARVSRARRARPRPRRSRRCGSAIPASATVYLLRTGRIRHEGRLMRTAWALSHVRLLGDYHRSRG